VFSGLARLISVKKTFVLMARQNYLDPLFLIKLLLMIFPFGLVSLSLSQPPVSLADQLSVEQSDEDSGDEPVGYAKPECTGKSCEPLPDDANACNTPAADKNPHCNGGGGGNELTDVIDEIEIVDPIVDPIDEITEPPDPDIDNVKPIPPGGGTCNNPENNNQNNSDQDCPEAGWEIVEDCDIDPSNPGCDEGEKYCELNPDDPICKLDPWEPTRPCLDGDESCELPGWGEIPEAGWPVVEDECLLNPDNPGCKEPDYCSIDPGHIECKEPELPEPPEETVACFAEDGATVYISEGETCSVATDAGKYSTEGYETVAMYAGSAMLLDSSDIVFETGTELFWIKSAKVIGNDFGVNASASESDLAVYLLDSSEVEIPYFTGSAGNNKVSLSREAKLTVSGDIVFQGGDDAIDNQGEIVVDGSISFGDGADILLQNGSEMIVEKGIDFGAGDDVLQTNGLLQIGDGPGGDDGFVVDGGADFDEAYFWDDGEALRLFPGYRVQNFERVYQQGGFWQYYGDLTHIPEVFIVDSSDSSVGNIAAFDAEYPAKFDSFVQAGGDVVAYMSKGKDVAPIEIDLDGSYDYVSGGVYVLVSEEDADSPEGRWKIISGNVTGVDEMAANTVLLFGSDLEESGFVSEAFRGLGKENALGIPSLYDIYLEKGSFNIVVETKTSAGLDCALRPDDSDCKEEEAEKPSSECVDDCEVGNKLPDVDGDGIVDEKDPDDDNDGQLDDLPGCEVGDDLCDIISDIEGDEDEALEEEEEAAGGIIDGILDGLEDDEIDLPLDFDYGQLARLVGSGLAPRNVDAAGRGLALHNNLLVDVVFDRQPLRQFEELLVAEEVVEESVMEGEAPVQPLWLKSDQLADREAAEYVEAAVEDVEVVDAAVNGEDEVAIEVEEEAAVVVESDGISLVDQKDDELDLARREGVSAWVKGFGGNSRADESSILYNDYDLNAYGTSVGVDVALSESFQIGAYANYGDLNVHQHSGETGGGSWNPEGWGGGLTAQYSTRHFYVQGLLGASEFNGEQSRNILEISDDLGGNTAKGDKSVTSYLGALRIGAPFKTGGVVLEPQGQVVWTRNHERGFSETSGTEKNLRLKYKSRTTNFAETELGMKLSVPIRTGERALLVPSLRAAWLADWNQGNEGQNIGYKFTKKTVNFDSQLGTENGALIEAGLDYTVQNFNSVSVKLYGRGGMEFWASDRGTTWRASGGVTFQF